MANNTMGNNQDKNRTGTPGTPGERREGMGREQEGRKASPSQSDQSGRQGQTDRSNQSGSQDRNRSGGDHH